MYDTQAQVDSLIKELEVTHMPKTKYAYATFKGTKIVNAQSVEMPDQGVLQFHIGHRFGRVNSGAYNFFGLDEATIRIGLDYGISKWLSVGVGRSKIQKAYDGYFKAKLLRQSTGEKKIPFTVVLYSTVAINTERIPVQDFEMKFKHKLVYTTQLLVARKLNEIFSLQIMPSYTHKNLVVSADLENDLFALGTAARAKLTKRIALTAEYFALMPGPTADITDNALSLGFDIETGGHVFQLHLTNSPGMIDAQFIPSTVGKWSKGDIIFGFNISRVFTIVKNKSLRKK